ncbi:MAG: PQQ-dependent sugar dehydrogenase, partial [Magnetospirillum sp.]|nr:PQQ-dependent sugar dehydrogenase [Magnetospirillum sp.]
GAAGGSAPQSLPFQITEVATFDAPWAMVFLPDGRALVTEKSGELKLWREGADAKTVSGAPNVVDEGQGGFGDVVLHPDFRHNQTIYLSWVEAGLGGKGAVVGRASLVEDKLGARLDGLQVIWRQEPKVSGSGHFGHRLAFGPDGMLYISSGERQKFDPAQDMGVNLGKIVRLTDTGMPPADKSATDAGRIAAQIWTSGHRNPLGLAFDSAGRLWEIEMGPRGGDEMNLIEHGKNYGWPRASNGSHYDGREIPDHKSGDGFAAPKVWWNPSISPSSLIIYSGKAFPKWQGDAFIGALSGQALIRVHLDGTNATKADQWPMNNRIREVEQGPDGAIWLLEDGEGGRLLKLAPR